MKTTTSALDKSAARALVSSLARQTFGGTIRAKLESPLGDYGDHLVVFTGGTRGEASIWLSVSTEARIRAHFAGYCAANGVDVAPHVGQSVVLPSASSPWGTRFGRVIKVGPKRAVVAYRFANGRETTKSVPFAALRFGALES